MVTAAVFITSHFTSPQLRCGCGCGYDSLVITTAAMAMDMAMGVDYVDWFTLVQSISSFLLFYEYYNNIISCNTKTSVQETIFRMQRNFNVWTVFTAYEPVQSISRLVDCRLLLSHRSFILTIVIILTIVSLLYTHHHSIS